MAISNTELTAILAEVEADLQKAYKEEAANLRKAAGDSEEASAPSEDGSSPADSGNDSPAPSPDESAEGSMPPPGAEGSMPPPGAEGSAPPPGGDPAGEQGVTPEALQAEYAQLPPEELQMHIQAAMAALEALQGASGAPGAEGSMPPGGAGGPPPGAGAPPPGMSPGPGASAGGPPGAMEGSVPPPPAMKGEVKVDKTAIGGKVVAAKSAVESNDLVKAQAETIQSLREDVENLTKAMEMFIGQPQRKAVTSMAQLGKSEPTSKTFTKAEVHQLVADNASKLTKAERELWIDFVDNRVPASKLAPMLERLAGQK